MTAIDKMSIAEKMRLATLGSKADREYLVKNNNRLVHMAAVTSPKVRLPGSGDLGRQQEPAGRRDLVHRESTLAEAPLPDRAQPGEQPEDAAGGVHGAAQVPPGLGQDQALAEPECARPSSSVRPSA